MKFKLPTVDVNWETAITALILLLFGMWGFRKCSARKADLQTQFERSPRDTIDFSAPATRRVLPPSSPNAISTTDNILPPPTNVPSQYSTPTPRPPRTPADVTMQAPPLPNVAAPSAPIAPNTVTSNDLASKGIKKNPTNAPTEGGGNKVTSRIYVLRQGLKLRESPDLNAKILSSLGKYEEVYFLDDVTPETTPVRLEDGTLIEKPWFKVRTKRGIVGWVHGSGVDFYKRPPSHN